MTTREAIMIVAKSPNHPLAPKLEALGLRFSRYLPGYCKCLHPRLSRAEFEVLIEKELATN